MPWPGNSKRTAGGVPLFSEGLRNAELFGGSLPDVLVTLQRHAKDSYGYFSPERFTERAGKGAAHELAMKPDHLVHKMVHVWRQVPGNPAPPRTTRSARRKPPASQVHMPGLRRERMGET